MPRADTLSFPLSFRMRSLPWPVQYARADAFLMEANTEGADIAASRASGLLAARRFMNKVN